MELIKNRTKIGSEVKTVALDNGDCYELKKIDNNQVVVCDQNVRLKDKIETVTINYKNHLMTGFQFRKQLKKIQYRWFNINTKNKRLTNSEWGNI